MDMNQQGTLLGSKDVQIIIPMMLLVQELNCQITTEDGQLKLIHPREGVIHLDMKTGSPLMKKDIALKLIDDLESKMEAEADIKKVIEQVLKNILEKLKDRRQSIEDEEKKQMDDFELSWWKVEQKPMLEDPHEDDDAEGKNFVLEAVYKKGKSSQSSASSRMKPIILSLIHISEPTRPY